MKTTLTQMKQMRVAWPLLGTALLILAGCGGGTSGGGSSPAPTYTIGGTVSGLGASESVTLSDNGADTVNVSADGAFSFNAGLTAGSAYDVAVKTHTPAIACSVSSGSGTVGTTSVSNIAVTCGAGKETVLYSFTGNDGTGSYASLIMDSAGNLYGTTVTGGANDLGTVFKLDPNGTETVLHSFGTGNDGQVPFGRLLMDTGGNLYGTTTGGGANNQGTVFKIDPSGAETVLHSFNTGPDGNEPESGLIMDSAGNLYGTTAAGGAYTFGTVFEIGTGGTETVLHSFASGSDGQYSVGRLIMDSGGNLFGTTSQGGASSSGTVFKIDPSGTETVLYSFNTGHDGVEPDAGLIMDSSGNLYGTTYYGGVSGSGTVFKIDPSGTETVLHSFGTGSDGDNPYAALVMDSAGNLYGTTYQGGVNGEGTAFKIDPSGTETELYSFGAGSDGYNPYAALVMDSAGNLYGTAFNGGASGFGTVFKID